MVVMRMVVVIVAREILITGLRTIAAYRGLLIPSSTAGSSARNARHSAPPATMTTTTKTSRVATAYTAR